MTTLYLARIEFEGHHGATDLERQSLRPFEVDVTIDVPHSKARSSDHLEDTVDYGRVAEIIVSVGVEESHHLIESLAGRMLDRLSQDFPEAAFHLELRKLNPPGCPGHPAFAAVRMDNA